MDSWADSGTRSWKIFCIAAEAGYYHFTSLCLNEYRQRSNGMPGHVQDLEASENLFVISYLFEGNSVNKIVIIAVIEWVWIFTESNFIAVGIK